VRAASSSSIGTTIPGSTIESLRNKTGADLASAMNPPKFSQMDSTLALSHLFPRRPLPAMREITNRPAISAGGL
jgi:hypothetical protein